MSGLGAKSHSISPDYIHGENDGNPGTPGAPGQDGQDGISGVQLAKTIADANYTPTVADETKYLLCTATGGCTITIEPQSTEAWTDSIEIHGTSLDGNTVFVAGAGVTIRTVDNFPLEAYRGSAWTLKRESENNWFLIALYEGLVGGGGAGGGTTIEGVRLAKNAAQSIPASTVTPITWQTEVFDDDGYADLGTNNTRITIPAGVTRVELTVGIDTASVVSDPAMTLFITKNGGAFPGIAISSVASDFAITKGVQVSTGQIEVAEGDYFEANAFFQDAVDIDATEATFYTMTIYKGEGGSGGGEDFSGAFLKLLTDEVGVSSGFVVPFEVEIYDTDDYADLGTDATRLTVPSDVDYVTATATVELGDTAQGENFAIQLTLYDDTDTLVHRVLDGCQIGFTNVVGTCTSPVWDVAPGYYVTVTVFGSGTFDVVNAQMSLKKEG